MDKTLDDNTDAKRNVQLDLQTLARASLDSDTYSPRDDDPLALPSERLLSNEHDAGDARKEGLSPHNMELIKSSVINLIWILTWYARMPSYRF